MCLYEIVEYSIHRELHSHPLSHQLLASFASEADPPLGFGCIWPGHGLLGGER